jgi:lysophospholipid acyltransferase (LPLAT)-like uncharacterized protein
MPAPIRFSDAPDKPCRLGPLVEPVIYVSNLAVAAWVYPAWRTARVRWEPDLASLVRLFQEHTRPLICYGWHAYELIMFCAFRPFPRQLMPMVIGHDGFLSRAMQQFGTWYGFPVWVYRRKSPIRPKTQLINLLANSQAVIGLFSDSGGPDGRVKPGLVEIAHETEAQLIPMAVQANPVIRIPGPRRYLIPLPFATVVAHYADPLDGRQCTLAQCQHALELLEEPMQQKCG